VAREPFQQESEVFCGMFSLPQSDSVVVEGLSKEYPIRINGASKVVSSNRSHRLSEKYGSHPNLPHNIERWTSVLKPSTIWKFEQLRQASIDGLMESGIGPVDRIVLSQ
ncbi:hypothetical protein EDC04DRAFT_2576932, partial [Pisolithus marmoratus]